MACVCSTVGRFFMVIVFFLLTGSFLVVFAINFALPIIMSRNYARTAAEKVVEPSLSFEKCSSNILINLIKKKTIDNFINSNSIFVYLSCSNSPTKTDTPICGLMECFRIVLLEFFS